MADDGEEKKMDLGNLLGALRVNSLKAAMANSPMEKRDKKKLVIKDSLRKTERYVVHHIDVDPMKVKKSRGETTLHNVTTVNRRTQRAMTAEEVADNCEKSIEFFRQARETNAKMEEMYPDGMFPKKGSAWAKMREKSKMRGKLDTALGVGASGAAEAVGEKSDA
eukprot:g1129.t1